MQDIDVNAIVGDEEMLIDNVVYRMVFFRNRWIDVYRAIMYGAGRIVKVVKVCDGERRRLSVYVNGKRAMRRESCDFSEENNAVFRVYM